MATGREGHRVVYGVALHGVAKRSLEGHGRSLRCMTLRCMARRSVAWQGRGGVWYWLYGWRCMALHDVALHGVVWRART